MSLPSPLHPSSESTDEVAPKACVNCGSIRLSTQTKLPVCEPCRLDLIKFPFPLWVKAAAAVIAALVVVSLVLSRERIHAAVQIAHAKKMKREGRWEESYQSYLPLIKEYDDTETLLNYAEAAMNSGHTLDAAGAMRSLAGREVTQEQNHRANSVVYQLERSTGSFLPPRPSLQMTDTGSAFQPDKPAIQLQTGGQSMPMNSAPASQILLGQPLQLNNVPIQIQTR